MKKSKAKKPNRCDVCLNIYIEDVPTGLTTYQYYQTMANNNLYKVLLVNHKVVREWHDPQGK